VKRKDLRLLLSIGSSRNLFIASIPASVFWSALVVANGFLIATIIIGVIERSAGVPERIIELALVWCARSLFQSQFERWSLVQATKAKAELRTRLVDSMGSFSSSPTSVTTLAIKGLNSLDMYIGRFVPQIIFATTTPLVVIATIFFLDPTSALIAIFTLPLIPLFGALIGKYTSDAVMKKWRELETLGRYFEDSMQGFVTLRSFGRHRSQSARILEMGKRYTEETMKVLRISFLSSLVLELCATISVALIAVSIGVRLVDGAIGFMPSLAILILAPEVYFPLRNAAALFHASSDGAQAMSELDSLTSKPLKGAGTKLSWKEWSSPFLEIVIPQQHIEAGQARILRGESGVGKTTFTLSLLDSLDPNYVSWIPQSPTLSYGTLREQFLRINPVVSDAELIELCSQVGLDLSLLPHGLDTQLGGSGEKSSHASGGQLRRIAIARALLKKAPLLIADEPTADLDRFGAIKVRELLDTYVANGGALLIVSHDEIFGDYQQIEVNHLER